MTDKMQPYSKEHKEIIHKIIDNLKDRTNSEHYIIICGVILSAYGNIKSRGCLEQADEYLEGFVLSLYHIYNNKEQIKAVEREEKNDGK